MRSSRTVGLAVGAGGLASRRFINLEIVPRFDNSAIRELEDSSVADIGNGSVVVTTDCYVVEPPVFPGGDIGRLAVAGSVNDLLASGATPAAMTLGLVLSEDFPMDVLRRILDSVASTAADARVTVIGGDTKVVEASAGLGVCISATGIGSPLIKGRYFRLRDARVGDRIIVTGTLGDHAIAVISAREGLGFETRIQSDCAPLDGLLLPILSDVCGVHALRDPTRGGVAGVLHDLAGAVGCHVRLDIDALPVKDEVRFCAEMLGLDPIELANEGKMLLVVHAEAADAVIERLRGHPLGRKAAVIGELRESSRGGIVTAVSAGAQEKIVVIREGPLVPRIC